MKKKVFSLLLAVIPVFFFSCSKEELENNSVENQNETSQRIIGGSSDGGGGMNYNLFKESGFSSNDVIINPYYGIQSQDRKVRSIQINSYQEARNYLSCTINMLNPYGGIIGYLESFDYTNYTLIASTINNNTLGLSYSFELEDNGWGYGGWNEMSLIVTDISGNGPFLQALETRTYFTFVPKMAPNSYISQIIRR